MEFHWYFIWSSYSRLRLFLRRSLFIPKTNHLWIAQNCKISSKRHQSVSRISIDFCSRGAFERKYLAPVRSASFRYRKNQTRHSQKKYLIFKKQRVTMTELSTLPSRRASIHVENFKNQIGKFVVRRRRSNSFFGRVNGRLTTSTSSLVSQISLSLTGEPAEVSTVTNLDTVLRYFIISTIYHIQNSSFEHLIVKIFCLTFDGWIIFYTYQPE